MPYDLKRSGSHSTNMEMEPPTPGSDEAKMTAADKKRNKLGYHRATTACTCCRHRKIRCQPGPPGHRCKMCEKLNKECKFESVTHPVSSDSRTSSISRPSGGHRGVSGTLSSSPGVSSARLGDVHGTHHGSMTIPSVQHMGLAESSDMKMGSGSLARSAYPDFNNQGIAANWSMAGSTSGPGRGKHSSWGPYGGHESGPPALGPSAFPPYSHGHGHRHTPPSGVPGGWAESSSRNDMPWPAYAPQQAGQQQPFSPTSAYDGKTPSSSSTAAMTAAEMYPPLPNMAPEPHAGVSSSSIASATGPVSQSGGYGVWGQHGYAPVPSKSSGFTGGWYSQAESGDHGSQAPMTTALPVSDGYTYHR
ncbi:hypothetical protein M406DRAFT_332841 [Cryphonectria parasitica EP155]|uniref:Zn(2)-C6 fungal-type domain-containing protein n=1 Tax=Cryphonectria parasitica (strain ATCC 38755 / EP155) TaxID=660469 RepID=A0A9P4XX07_CRYP1|nr:uncharacterized protein M406DRAFT_332841 [Cryphonectria parasitica EP155]KAF3762458.1 hypothetical protein M406DRAFT_332841 [Cryphonectria parasitica EP155]